MADAIAHDDEATAYREQLEKIKKAFNQKYARADGTLTVPTQTAYALALYADVIPEAKRKAFGQTLADMIHKNGNRMTTGFLGTRPLLPVLSSVGQNDLAVFLFQSRAFPSWGYEVEQGATTIWERWDSYTKKDAFGRHNAAMNSFAHYAFGAVCEWMFRTLAGIQSDGPGYKKIIIRPMPPSPGSNAERRQIDWVDASYKSIRGLIKSRWHLKDGRFELNITIPTNTTATVYIPAIDVLKVTESGLPISQAKGVRVVRTDGDRLVVVVESGKYSFVSRGASKRATEAFKTSEPPDKSISRQEPDISKGRRIAQWDFRNPDDVAKWSKRNNLKIERRKESTFLVATGSDPQIETELDRSATGPLVLQIHALPSQNTSVQLFWASSKGSYSAGASVRRELKTTDKMQEYLFPIGDGKPIRHLRFDPFPDRGEMRIQAIALYRLDS